MENMCPNATKCPIFTGILVDKTTTAKSYSKQFCESNYSSCKRFMTKNKFGMCPPELLPNSLLSLDEIEIKYKLILPVTK